MWHDFSPDHLLRATRSVIVVMVNDHRSKETAMTDLLKKKKATVLAPMRPGTTPEEVDGVMIVMNSIIETLNQRIDNNPDKPGPMRQNAERVAIALKHALDTFESAGIELQIGETISGLALFLSSFCLNTADQVVECGHEECIRSKAAALAGGICGASHAVSEKSYRQENKKPN